jgi:hypothetical protein
VAVVGVIVALLLAAFGGYEALDAIEKTVVAHRAEVRAVSTELRQLTKRGDARHSAPSKPNTRTSSLLTHRWCKRRSKNPSLKRPVSPVAPE